MYDVKGLRAVALYRVSTDKQASKDDKDIPAQRAIVADFVKSEGLVLVKEYTETGVSGFKAKTKDRDKIQSIFRMAEKKEFAILVAYKSDRIGRNTIETPAIVYQLNQLGIRVLTVNDGEQKTDDQNSKLMLYLQTWQSETESVKISQRVSDYQKILVKSGYFRGGFVPCGYDLIDDGGKNLKGKPIKSLVINSEKAEVVKLIYDLSINNNMGARAIASHLNSGIHKTKAPNGDHWTFRGIQVISNNPIYKGVIQYKSSEGEIIQSKPQESLTIIQPDIWEQNQRKIQSRKITPNEKTHNTGVTSGKTLLSGLVYCGHCEKRLHVWPQYKSHILKDGTKKSIIVDRYRCPSHMVRNAGPCDGQSVYSSKKIDSIVEPRVLLHIGSIVEDEKNNIMLKSKLKQNIAALNKQIKSTQSKLSVTDAKIKGLQGELGNVILGISKFTVEDLNAALSYAKQEKDNYLVQIDDLKKQLESAESSYKDTSTIINTAKSVISKYHDSDMLQKKAIMALYIDKVVVYKDEVKIIYKDTMGCVS